MHSGMLSKSHHTLIPQVSGDKGTPEGICMLILFVNGEALEYYLGRFYVAGWWVPHGHFNQKDWLLRIQIY